MNIIPWRDKGESGPEAEQFETAISRLRGEMDDLFSRVFRGSLDLGRGGWGPRMDLAESDKEITIKVELPGVESNDIDLDVIGNTLTIRGEKKVDREEHGCDYHHVERQYGSFNRSVQLPTTIDPEKVSAEFKNGILTVTLAKHAEAQPRRITVRNG